MNRKNQRRESQRGSVVTYLLIALFLMGLLAAALTQGAKKSVSSSQIDEMMLYLQTDIKLIHSAIMDCTQTYPTPVDVDGNGTINTADNPNAPFPLYGKGARATLTSGGTGHEGGADTGSDINGATSIGCPGNPNASTAVFSGNYANKFKLLGDTATYTTTYFNNGNAASTEGVYIRITRSSSDPLWTEALSRLNTKYSTCSAAVVTAAGTCVNGCFYYWLVRLPTSVITGGEACP